ncbi:MAG: hypothetical protein RR808_04740 [Akkermansia sp.]
MAKKFKPLELPFAYDPGDGWFVPVRKVQVDDKIFALQLQPPVQVGSAYDIEKHLRISRKILTRLEKAGFINVAYRPSPHLSMYYYAEIQAFLDRTRQDTKFWDNVKTQAYMTGSKLEDSSCY